MLKLRLQPLDLKKAQGFSQQAADIADPRFKVIHKSVVLAIDCDDATAASQWFVILQAKAAELEAACCRVTATSARRLKCYTQQLRVEGTTCTKAYDTFAGDDCEDAPALKKRRVCQKINRWPTKMCNTAMSLWLHLGDDERAMSWGLGPQIKFV